MLQDVMFLHVTSGRANVTSGMVGKLDQCSAKTAGSAI